MSDSIEEIRAGLPPAAQRWLARALPSGQHAPDVVRLQQTGELDVRGKWTPFTAKGLYQATPLAFDWRARLAIMPGVWAEAGDGHAAGKGWGGAKLWGLISMGRREDAQVFLSQLVRNLGELPWLPSFALHDTGLDWQDIGLDMFGVRLGEAQVQFTLDDADDIVLAASPARPYDVPDGYEVAPWQVAYSGHRDFAGVRLPATAVMAFDKPDGRWEYMRVTLTGTA